MADLSANVVLGYGRQVIMPPNPTLLVNHPGEAIRQIEALARAITLQGVPAAGAMRLAAHTVTAAIADASFVLKTASNTGLAGAGISEASLSTQGSITYSTN